MQSNNAVKQVLKDGYRTIDIMPQEEDKKSAVEQVGTSRDGRSDLREIYQITGYVCKIK